MSTDYNLKICRKADDKVIGVVQCNRLKNIFDTEFAKYIGCETNSWHYDNAKFEMRDLENGLNSVNIKIENLHENVFEKKMMIALAKSKDIKLELEQDIMDIRSDIAELMNTSASFSVIIGIVECVSVDMFKGKQMAYEYNAKGLPKRIQIQENGTTAKYDPFIFEDDVYCIIEVCN